MNITIKITDKKRIDQFKKYLKLRKEAGLSTSANDFGKQMFYACFDSTEENPIRLKSINEIEEILKEKETIINNNSINNDDTKPTEITE